MLLNPCAEQPSEGAGELPEAAEAVRAEPAAQADREDAEEEEPVQGTAQHQVFPNHRAGLGGGRLAGMAQPCV